MPPRSLALLATLAVAALSSAAAQDSPSTAADIQAGTDRLPITGTARAVSQTFMGWTETVEATLRYEYVETTGLNENYQLVGGRVQWTAAGPYGTACTASGSAAFDLDAATDFGDLNLTLSDSTYTVVASSERLRAQAKVTLQCESGTFELPALQFVALDVPLDPAYRNRNGVMAGRREGISTGGAVVFEWALRHTPQAVELVVTPDGYDTWLPEGDLEDPDARGNVLHVRAELRATDGSPSPVEAVRYRFELGDVSREPGVAMNWPLTPAPEQRPDLQITGGTAVTGIDLEEGTWAETGPGTQAHVEVSSFDFGGWATITVVATLPDGREVLGHLVHETNYTRVRLPQRAADSFVADAWKSRHGVAGRPDGEDADALPLGDGHPGDGLTLYEEYRGFRLGGDHVRASPTRKSLLIANSLGPAVYGGIALFRQLSELDVHPGLAIDEDIDRTDRLVNANHARGPHAVDQHGVWIARWSETLISQSVSMRPGTPGGTSSIEISRAIDDVQRHSTVAHELFHSVNVWHHGEDDTRDAQWTVRRDASGRVVRDADGIAEVLEDGRPVQVLNESGQRVNPLLVQLDAGSAARAERVYVGVPHGEHSGHEDCVMRYAAASAYVRPSSPARYLAIPPEVKGRGICEFEVGTYVNDPERLPHPRYDGVELQASNGPRRRGRCRFQICVNDAHTHQDGH